MRPPTRSNNPPKYAEDLLDSQFEDLCRDLLAREPGIKSCVRYGVSGQKQHGIDLLARSILGGVEVAQCKCYKEFDEKDLEKAVSEFLRCKDHWQTWGITRFVLMVGCSANNAKVQDEGEVQRKKLEEIDIIFDLWGADLITEKLKSHPDLVEIHVGSVWVRKICGPDIATKLVSRVIGQPTSHGPLGELLAECADSERSTINEKFDGIRELAKIGLIESAFNRIQEYIKSPQWSLLDPRSQGRGLRLVASLYLDHLGDVKHAKESLEEARRLAPEENYQVIDASIALRNQDRSAALAIVTPPLNLDAWNFKLALLAEAGRFSEIVMSIEAPLLTPNANTWRLGSLAKLFLGNFSQAKEYADLALKESPKWYLVRLHAAKMAYLSTLLPNFPMLRHMDWPIPPERQYIRTDTASIEMLGRAEVGFKEILDEVELASAERMAIEGWRLGCVANNANRRQEAAKYAQHLLEQNATHYPAIVWSLERGFDINKQSLLNAAERIDDGVDLSTLQALCAALAQSSPVEETLKFLSVQRHHFERLKALFSWRLLKVQILEEKGDPTGVEEVVHEESDPSHRMQLRMAVSKIKARKTGDTSVYIDDLLESYETGTESQILFDLYESLVMAGRSEDATKWTAELLSNFPTSSALVLALQAHFDCGQFSKCLEVIEENRSCFPNQRIPSRIVRMEIECLRQSGRLAAAKQLAEVMVRDEQSTESLVALFQTQMTLADFKECVATIRKLLVRPDLTVAGILQMAAGIQLEDMSLARDCWKEAARRGLESAPEIAAAVNLAFRLGLEEEVSSLMPMFFALAQEDSGSITVTNINDVKAMMSEHEAREAQATKTFNAAQVPSHLLAGAINAPLAAMLVENMRGAANSGKPHQHFPALIRPGSKTEVWSSVPLEGGKLFMDVTAIYIAEEIGIIDLIEKKCAPIYISSHALEFMQDEILRVTPHQPSLHQPREMIVSMVEQKLLGTYDQPDPRNVEIRTPADVTAEWRRMLACVMRSGGVMCDFMPPRDLNNDLISLSPEELSAIVACGDLVESLRKIGEFNDEEATLAYRKLGVDGQPFNPTVVLPPKMLIVLEGGMAEQLAKANALEPLCRAFDLKITRRSLDNVQAEVASYQRRVSLARRLKMTAEHLTRGISNGVYKTIAKNASAIHGTDDSNVSPLHHCLLDMLAVEDFPIAVVWADDRYLLRFNHVGSSRMVGVCEIISTLKSHAIITESQYFDCLLRLRVGNARYIPIEGGEVGNYIKAALVTNGELIETKRLKIIRRYMAAVFSDFGRIGAPVRTEGGVDAGEFMWVVNALKAVSLAMAGLWQEEGLSDAEREAKADWLLNNLYVPYYGAIEAATREAPNGDPVHGMANSILLMIQAGFTLQDKVRVPLRTSNVRSKYYDWIARRLVEPMVDINPQVVSCLASDIESILLKRRDKGMNKRHRRVSRRLIQQLVVDLPNSLLRKLQFTRETRSWLGIKPFGSFWGITAYNHEFAAVPFWRAIARASRGRSSVVTATNNKRDFVIAPAAPGKNSRRGVRFTGNGIDRHLQVENLPLFSEDNGGLATFLRSKSNIFDRAEDECVRIISDISGIKDSGKRIAKFTDERSRSAAHHYHQLCKKVRLRSEIETPDMLPPDSSMLHSHLRLNPQELMRSDATSLAANRLLAQIGLAETIERIASQPILLPPEILSAANEVSAADFRALMARLRRRVRHPLGQVHLFHLMAARGVKEDVWVVEAIKLRDILFDVDTQSQNWSAFQKAIKWTEDQMRSLHSYRSIKGPARLLLVWLHASKLFDSLALAGADANSIEKALGVWSLARGVRLERWDTEFYCDVIHPRFIDFPHCTIRGMGAVLNSLPLAIAGILKLTAVPLELPEKNNIPGTRNLFLDHTQYFNNYGSFFGESLKSALLQCMEESIVQQFMPDDLPIIINSALTDVAKDGCDMSAWHTLAMTVDDGLVQPEVGENLAAAMEDASNKGLLHTDGNDFLLLFFARRSTHGISAELRTRMEEAIWRKVSILRKRALIEGGKVPTLEFNLLLVCLGELSVVPADETFSHRRFNQTVSHLAVAWPEAVTQIDGLSVWPTVLPMTCQAGYWEAAMSIRLSKA